MSDFQSSLKVIVLYLSFNSLLWTAACNTGQVLYEHCLFFVLCVCTCESVQTGAAGVSRREGAESKMCWSLPLYLHHGTFYRRRQQTWYQPATHCNMHLKNICKKWIEYNKKLILLNHMIIFWWRRLLQCNCLFSHPVSSLQLHLTKVLLIYQHTLRSASFVSFCRCADFWLRLIYICSVHRFCFFSSEGWNHDAVDSSVFLYQHLATLSYQPFSQFLSLCSSFHRELHRAGPGRSGWSPAGLVSAAPRQREAEQHRESCCQLCFKWG